MDEQQDDAEPSITTLGPGTPTAALVGGVHGDEPSGVRAVEGIVRDVTAGSIELTDTVRCIIANPPAVAANRRYLEVDMNRSFPGEPDGPLEARLAVPVCEAIAGIPTLALHATRSTDTPFAFVSRGDEAALDLASSLSVSHIVVADGAEIGSLAACGSVVTVEVGPQGSEQAADDARSLADEFLIATGALAGSVSTRSPAVFEIGEEIDRPPGEQYEVLVENFERVEAGQAFARVDGRAITADESFYPVLLSVDGYEEILGFSGRKLADSVEELR